MQDQSARRNGFGQLRRNNDAAGDTASTHRFIPHLKLAFLLAALSTSALVGCGGSSTRSFTLDVAPTSISIVAGGPAQSLTVVATPVNGFKGTVSVALGSLPAGVTASPSTLSLAPGKLGQFTLTASSSAAAGTTTVTLTATSGSVSQKATSAVTVSPVPPDTTSATLSTPFFNFGNNLVNNAVTQTVAVVTNTGPNPLAMSPALSGDASYSIVSGSSCGATLAPSATCDMVVKYDPTVPSAPATQDAVLSMGFGNVTSATQQTVVITGASAALSAGVVTATNNPQVALYTMTLPFPGSITVNFGTTTSYGLKTWAQSTDSPGGQVSIFVAGMRATTTYHMAATVQFSNGITATDTDHTFTTQAVPASILHNFTVSTTAGMTPQPGLEMLNGLNALAVIDLSGNILWTYSFPGTSSQNDIQGVKMLPNGDVVMAFAPNSAVPLVGPIDGSYIVAIREVNLAGDTVREVTVNDLNSELATATCAECHVTLADFHHEITPLPNGHWLVLANTLMNLSATSTPALTNAPAQAVLGDVIVDLDQNLRPVWAWNEFNHLDPNRHPMQFPDWTHTNAVIYSPDDGNILVSMRHQNWVVKVGYENGTGNGNILWRLGQGGDFTLVGGTDPTDWEYAQHGPSFTSANTTGVFSLVLMDNGDDRIFPSGVTCSTTGGTPPCLYSTVPIFQIDETAKIATLTFHQIAPTALYNLWGGNAEQLANGNVEYDLCGVGATYTNSYLFEVTREATPKTVWSLVSTGVSYYRAFRIPSLYPGVQW